jgi:hypothetical protein
VSRPKLPDSRGSASLPERCEYAALAVNTSKSDNCPVLDKTVRADARSQCGLCGFQPSKDSATPQLRLLGSDPVTVTVCADPADCVLRYAGGHRPGAPTSGGKREDR